MSYFVTMPPAVLQFMHAHREDRHIRRELIEARNVPDLMNYIIYVHMASFVVHRNQNLYIVLYLDKIFILKG